MLLAGIAIGAFFECHRNDCPRAGDMRGYILLTWISGSTNRAGPFEAWTAVSALAGLAARYPA
jgi:iron complex transport system permease protein